MFPESVIKRAQEREDRSKDHETRFLAGDETALRDFCRTDPFAMKTKWVQDAIQKALFCHNRALLDTLFVGAGQGKKKSRVTTLIEDLIIMDAVDRAALETGLPKKSQPIKYNPKDEMPPPETVFDWLFRKENRPFFPSLSIGSARTLYNRYIKMENTGPDFMIEDTPDGKILRKGPDIIPLSLFGLGDKTVIGILEVFIPSDGGEHKFNVNAVFNVPDKSSIKEDIKQCFENAME